MFHTKTAKKDGTTVYVGINAHRLLSLHGEKLRLKSRDFVAVSNVTCVNNEEEQTDSYYMRAMLKLRESIQAASH